MIDLAVPNRHTPPRQRRAAVTGFLMLLLCLIIVFATACRKRGTALLEQAQIAWDGGDFMSSAARYEEFLKENPLDEQAASARFKLANVYLLNLKKYDLSIQHYIHLIEDFPKSPDILLARQRLAESYAASKDFRAAIQEYENLLIAAPAYPEKRRIRLAIADLYYDLNEMGQALAEYEKVTVNNDYDDLSERAWLRIGGINQVRNEYDDALKAYQVITEKTQSAVIRRSARLSQADCYERMFKYEDAIKILAGTEVDQKEPGYLPNRITSIREQQRQRNLSTPNGGLRSRK